MTEPAFIDTSWTPLRMIDGPRRPNLVIIRTGKKSIHTEWGKDLGGGDRNWDLLLSHYADTEPTCPDAEIIVRQGAFKFSACHRLFQDIDWLRQYSAIWFCDDDIATSWADINRRFDLFNAYELALAQPALTLDSYFSHRITLQQSEYLMRFTNFVEIMAPIFSKAAWQACLPSCEGATAGFGLDFVWPHLVSKLRHKVAVIDALPVKHTRPVMQGDMYSDIKEKKANPAETELIRNVTKYGVGTKLLAYGSLNLNPQPFGPRAAEAASPAVMEQMDKLIALLAKPEMQAWQALPSCRAVLPQWSSADRAASAPHDIPPLTATDAVMSFGFHFNLQSLGGNSAELLQIGAERDRARVIVTADAEENGKCRINLAIIDKNTGAVALSLPNIPLHGLVKFHAQLVPSVGYVKVWINDQLVGQGLIAAWQWVDVTRVWLGSSRLQGVLQSAWIAPAAA